MDPYPKEQACSFWSQFQMQYTPMPQQLRGGAAGVRVDFATLGKPEATAKQGDTNPVPKTHHMTKIRKRSLLRAIARAEKNGSR